MSITIKLIYYDKNKDGDLIESGNTRSIIYKDFINPYPKEIFIELKEKFPLKIINVYESEGEDKDLYQDCCVLDNLKLNEILNYILDKINKTEKENEELLYNLNIIKDIIEIKINSPSYSNNDNINIEIDYYYT